MRRQAAIALALAATLAVAPGAAGAGCAEAVAQAELTQCAYLDWQAADAGLNLAYAQAKGAMNSIDLALPAHDRGAERALREAQRAWITVRDETCRAEAWAMHGGTAEPMLLYGCMARESGARAAVLRAMAENY